MKMKLEVLVSITAMITAVVAVVVAIIQTQVMREEAEIEREHTRLSVQPALLVYAHSRVGDTDGNFRYGLRNQGLGPAVIEGFSVSLNGKNVSNWAEFVANATEGAVHLRGEKRNVSGIMESSLDQGMIIPAGGDMMPISLDSDNHVAALLRSIDDNALVTVCYCSLYKECWTATNQNTRPHAVKNCKAYNLVNFSDLESVK